MAYTRLSAMLNSGEGGRDRGDGYPLGRTAHHPRPGWGQYRSGGSAMSRFAFWRRPAVKKSRPRTRLCLETLEERTLLSSNAIVLENQLPGAPQSQWDVSTRDAGDATIQGFAADISV